MSETVTLFTDKQAAKLLGVTVITLWRWRKAGLIRCRKQGRWIRFTLADIQEFIEKSLRGADNKTRQEE